MLFRKNVNQIFLNFPNVRKLSCSILEDTHGKDRQDFARQNELRTVIDDIVADIEGTK